MSRNQANVDWIPDWQTISDGTSLGNENQYSSVGGRWVYINFWNRCDRWSHRKQLDKLVKMLADTADSQDSKRQVSQLMLGAIQGPSRSIELYAYKRREMSERIKKGDETALVDLGQVLDGAC